MKKFIKSFGVVLSIFVFVFIISSCTKQFEGTWVGYSDNEYIRLAILGSTWETFQSSGVYSHSGNVIMLKENGKTVGTGTVIGKSMNLDYKNKNYFLVRK